MLYDWSCPKFVEGRFLGSACRALWGETIREHINLSAAACLHDLSVMFIGTNWHIASRYFLTRFRGQEVLTRARLRYLLLRNGVP